MEEWTKEGGNIGKEKTKVKCLGRKKLGEKNRSGKDWR